MCRLAGGMWTVEGLITSEHLVLVWPFTSWWIGIVRGLLTALAYCARLLPLTLRMASHSGVQASLHDPGQAYLLHSITFCHAEWLLVQCRGIPLPKKTCGKGLRFASTGRALSSGRCCLPIWRDLPDGETVSVPQSLYLPEALSEKMYPWQPGGLMTTTQLVAPLNKVKVLTVLSWSWGNII